MTVMYHACVSICMVLSLISTSRAEALNSVFLAKLDKALEITQSTIQSIYNEWEVDKYPNFLKSCHMHKVGWELLKLRFEKKIVEAELYRNREITFVISFTGSSVTAGHDSHFNYSTPIVTGDLMKASLEALSIELDSRNVALGNNPCTPYDVCVKYFGGLDADIVHWEQSYFCDGGKVIEQFIRQAMLMPSKPLVVFSESNTGHWEKSVCKADHKKHTVTHAELQLLNSSNLHLVSELNKDEFHRAFGFLDQYMKMYHAAGIQTFHHLKHDQYACMGPYIAGWMEGAASWHPSVIGHRLRAAHHAYFWLLNYKDAIESVRASVSHRQLDAMYKDIETHLHKLTHVKLEPARHSTIFPDKAKCYTDYEPRPLRDSSLKSKVLKGLAPSEKDKGWKFIIYELLVDPNLVKRSYQNGYHDFKHLMYGDESSGPLSLSLQMEHEGPIIICETPGIWGSLPAGFKHFWDPDVLDIYVTFDAVSTANEDFAFDKETASKLVIHHTQELEICAEIIRSKHDVHFKAGSHVLTVVPKTSTKVILAWLITA